MAFKKAVKSQAKLRAALFGPSGAGKTFSALAIASGMGKRVAFIDSERGSASKYADRFDFDVLDLEEKSIDSYVEAIAEAGQAGYDVLIIDSLSHAWQELLEQIDKLANAKYRGNTWSAWSEGTPKQHKLVDAILDFPGHLLATMRSKTEWQTEQGNGGKSKPVRVGLSPEQGKGIEYEFDLLLELSTDHIANVIKDRTGKFQDKLIDKPGKQFGEQLVAWLNEGAPAQPLRGRSSAPNPEPGNQGGKAPASLSIDEQWRATMAELGKVLTASVGAVPAFSEEDKADYQARVKSLPQPRTVEALQDIVLNAQAALDALRSRWEEAGSPTPRPDDLDAYIAQAAAPKSSPAKAAKPKPAPIQEPEPEPEPEYAMAGGDELSDQLDIF